MSGLFARTTRRPYRSNQLRPRHVRLQRPRVFGQRGERVEAEGGGKQNEFADVEVFFFAVGREQAERAWLD